MAVIEKYKTQKGCILCELSELPLGSESLLIGRSSKSFVVMNKFPYSNGHLMIVPVRHEANWEALSAEEVLDVGQMSQKAVRILKQALSAQACNLGANLGTAAGAGIPEHVHWHVVPRWEGDFNFMPLLSETKVISEHLEVTYQKIRQAWDQEGEMQE